MRRGGLTISKPAKEAAAISPVLNAAEEMFADAASAASRNRRQKWGFIALTVLIAIGGAVAARFFVAERNLVFAVSRKDSASDQFAQSLREIASRNRGVRVIVKNFDGPIAAVQQFAQGRADLAIVRSDTRAAARARRRAARTFDSPDRRAEECRAEIHRRAQGQETRDHLQRSARHGARARHSRALRHSGSRRRSISTSPRTGRACSNRAVRRPSSSWRASRGWPPTSSGSARTRS